MATGFFCTDNRIPTAIFFPQPESKIAVNRAKDYCKQCDRQEDCLHIALEHRDMIGIFGGMTYDERRAYSLREALKAGKASYELQNTLHVQQHPVYVSPVFLSRNSNVQIRTPLVLSSVVVVSQSCPVTLPKFV